MPTTIVQKDDPVLREIAREVPIKDILTPKIVKILVHMKKALAHEDDGVAIAAPQIGVPLRIFIVSGKVIGYMKGEEDGEHKYPDMVFINPRISKYSKEKKFVEEGCLSIRYLYGKVSRSTKVHIEAYDENGIKFKRGASGLLAQVFQHEHDHLDGILFTDTAKDVEDIPPHKMIERSHTKKK
jgi:peptide deformylase